MLSYYISISYLSDNLIQISEKCVKWSLVLIRLSLSIVDGYDGMCVNLDPGIEIHFTLFLAFS